MLSHLQVLLSCVFVATPVGTLWLLAVATCCDGKVSRGHLAKIMSAKVLPKQCSTYTQCSMTPFTITKISKFDKISKNHEICQNLVWSVWLMLPNVDAAKCRWLMLSTSMLWLYSRVTTKSPGRCSRRRSCSATSCSSFTSPRRMACSRSSNPSFSPWRCCSVR